MAALNGRTDTCKLETLCGNEQKAMPSGVAAWDFRSVYAI